MSARIGFAMLLAGLVATPALAQTPDNVAQAVRFRAQRDTTPVVAQVATLLPTSDVVTTGIFRVSLGQASTVQLTDLGPRWRWWNTAQLAELGPCPRGCWGW